MGLSGITNQTRLFILQTGRHTVAIKIIQSLSHPGSKKVLAILPGTIMPIMEGLITGNFSRHRLVQAPICRHHLWRILS